MFSFVEKRNYQSQVIKAQAKFGKNKEACITPFQGRTYVHVSDMKKCFQGDGSFDLSQSKSISFGLEEVRELRALLEKVEHYDAIYHTPRDQQTTPERRVTMVNTPEHIARQVRVMKHAAMAEEYEQSIPSPRASPRTPRPSAFNVLQEALTVSGFTNAQIQYQPEASTSTSSSQYQPEPTTSHEASTSTAEEVDPQLMGNEEIFYAIQLP